MRPAPGTPKRAGALTPFPKRSPGRKALRSQVPQVPGQASESMPAAVKRFVRSVTGRRGSSGGGVPDFGKTTAAVPGPAVR